MFIITQVIKKRAKYASVICLRRRDLQIHFGKIPSKHVFKKYLNSYRGRLP
jgi:hypothetical protein